MIVVDDVLFFPMRSLLFIFKEIQKQVLEEMAQEAQNVRDELARLYLEIEAGRMSEEEFAEQESSLLDRLDELEVISDGDEEDTEEDDDDDAQ